MDPFLLMLAVMLVLFVTMNYFGKKKTAQVREQRLSAVVIGNSVRTHSGFFGTIVDIDGDTVTLESPSGVETMWHKDSIFGAQEPPLASLYDDAPEDATAIELGAEVEQDAVVEWDGTREQDAVPGEAPPEDRAK